MNFVKFLITQRITGFEPPGDEPLMDEAGKARFAELAKQSHRLIEYGSGGSTIMADRLGLKTLSVDSDRFYAKAVASKLTGNCVRQVWANIGVTRGWGNPVRHTPAKGRTYIDAPFQPEHRNYFGEGDLPDFILVDGRYRAACALSCGARLKAGGAEAILLIDDYVDRDNYLIVEKWLGKPQMYGRVAEFKIGQMEVPTEAIELALNDPR